jgi:hypothetical protein
MATKMFTAYPMVHTRKIALDIGIDSMHPEQGLDPIHVIYHYYRLMGALIVWRPETLWMQSMKAGV